MTRTLKKMKMEQMGIPNVKTNNSNQMEMEWPSTRMTTMFGFRASAVPAHANHSAAAQAAGSSAGNLVVEKYRDSLFGVFNSVIFCSSGLSLVRILL